MAQPQPTAKKIQPSAHQAPPPDVDAVEVEDPFHRWFAEEGAWWGASFVFHMLLMCTAMLLGNTAGGRVEGDAPSFAAAKDDEAPDSTAIPDKIDKLDAADVPIDPTDLSVDTLTAAPSKSIDNTAEAGDPISGGMTEGGGRPMAANAPDLGGLGGFTVIAHGPGARVTGSGGVGVGIGTGEHSGMGGSGYGFGSRGHRGGGGATKASERAVALALNWLARHQNYDGHWSLQDYVKRCTDGGASCTGPGNHKTDAGATALGLLPFLAAGQTHEGKGAYKNNVFNGIFYLIKNQKANGDLTQACSQRMYTQGLCTICLCEAYGMSHDRAIAGAAQKAVDFIQAAQNTTTGGWRYEPGDPGDTSVVGWQVMALKSAQLAYLNVNPAVLEGAKKWLDSCASGEYKGNFSYQPGGGGSDTMTSVGVLCRQYLGAHRDDGCIREGKDYLMAHQADMAQRNLYYWYYATQVMHNLPGPDWDAWNRKMRKTLIESQVHDSATCAVGSWDPDKPTRDLWGVQGGRIMVTSLAALTLEVYYRYTPLFKLDNEAALPAAGKPAAEEKKEEKEEKEDK